MPKAATEKFIRLYIYTDTATRDRLSDAAHAARKSVSDYVETLIKSDLERSDQGDGVQEKLEK